MIAYVFTSGIADLSRSIGLRLAKLKLDFADKKFGKNPLWQFRSLREIRNFGASEHPTGFWQGKGGEAGHLDFGISVVLLVNCSVLLPTGVGGWKRKAAEGRSWTITSLVRDLQ